MAEAQIITRHPQGKSGRRISRERYNLMKNAILTTLRKRELTHSELLARVTSKLSGKFDGNISWYGETVKLDLEARKIILRTSSTPVRYKLKGTVK